jgi:dihydroorotase
MEVTEVEANEDPHLQCMPYPKTDFDVRAVQQAAMTHPRFFYGSDNAPHLRPAKERQVPPPASGVFTAPVELPAIVEIFQREGQLDKLEAFLSERGARWHGYPFNEGEIQLVRNPWIVPEVIDLGGGHQIIPYKHGQTLPWRLA